MSYRRLSAEEVWKIKECLRKVVGNGDLIFQMLKTSHRNSERRSQHAASELQKAFKARDSAIGYSCLPSHHISSISQPNDGNDPQPRFVAG